MKRSSGILLPISSLPSKYGIGCFDESAYKFVDFLKECKQTYWQILPLGPTSYGDSPYQSFSTFAGNPYFIDLNELVHDGFLTKDECEAAGFFDTSDIDYGYLYEKRFPLLKVAFERSQIIQSEEFKLFCDKNSWLDDYALFMALKDHFGGISWDKWEYDIRLRNESSIREYRSKLSSEIDFYKFLQYFFYRHWHRLKAYANENGIKIIGDIPMYVAFDSADVWANPQLFQLDENRLPKAVAGCPPDDFTADGQLWGNPLYDWNHHKETNYEWWISRFRSCFELYDVVRIDHFRGFDEYYAVPYGERTAKNGHWEKGPEIELFHTTENVLGRKEFIAEDLGFITDSVRQLVRDCNFPNIKVLEFAFDVCDTESKNEYLPHNYAENCVAYTGTHDNQTIVSWFESISDEERAKAREYLCDSFTPNEKLHKSFISLIMRSQAYLCIIPIQDWLGLDDKSRINEPSTVGQNWRWRLCKDSLNEEIKNEILNTTKLYGRA